MEVIILLPGLETNMDVNDSIDLPGQFDSSKNLKRRTRPPKEIDVQKLKEFLEVNMPIKRIGHYFNCTPETLYNKYADLIIESNVNYEFHIRQAQLRTALSGNPTMLIWLGKQYLGQRDMLEPPVKSESPSVTDIKFLPLTQDDTA